MLNGHVCSRPAEASKAIASIRPKQAQETFVLICFIVAIADVQLQPKYLRLKGLSFWRGKCYPKRAEKLHALKSAALIVFYSDFAVNGKAIVF